MQIKSQVAWLPKAGNAPDEYEDAFWPEHDIACSAQAFSFAVADGATEASFSGIWARLLTRAWCRGWFGDKRIDQALPKLQQEWLQAVSTRPLPWYAQMKLEKGAFATLLGLHLRSTGDGRGAWHAMSVGDCLLVQVRDGRLLRSFPLDDDTQFTSNPRLIGSRPELVGNAKQARLSTSGEWSAGDRFYLLSDAIAAWTLREAGKGAEPWDLLDTTLQEGDFPLFIRHLRSRQEIRNDDVTVKRIELA